MKPLLQIENLSVALPPGGERALAVEEVSFEVGEDEIVCLVGESGSGKSMTAHAVLGLLPRRVGVSRGRILFRGQDLAGLSRRDLRAVRGRDIGMIFQEPLSALNPLQRVGVQVAESLQVHGGKSRHHIAARSLELLRDVGLPDPRQIAQSYPFQLSGGQRQRVMIAGALANNPALLLADEPTTALDVTTQRQILDLILGLKTQRRMGVLFITHDFGVVADIADRVVVMRQGRVVETGPGAAVLRNPRHEYTRALIEAVPGRERMRALEAGAVPPSPPPDLEADAGKADPSPLLVIEGLAKTFVTRQDPWSEPRRVVAAEDVSLTLGAGETVAVVGESGSGKSTLARMILRLVEPDAGTLRYEATDVHALRGEALRQYRRQVQIVFQDPYASLNPRQKVGDAIARGPRAFGTPRGEAERIARDLLARVGLDPTSSGRYPHEFSGGQRQRIAIARALALGPKLLVADEPVSALDVSIQAQVLALLAELKRELGLAMLFVTHDLRVASEIADRVVVMRQGRIVEQGPATALLADPRHPYTRELLEAIPGRAFFAGGAPLVIDAERFWGTVERSAEIGAGRPGGLSRLALTDSDKEIRDLFVTWCKEAGLTVTVDQVGSIFARRAGREDHLPPVMIGSHLDSQANGGRFDGVIGVMGAVEVVRRLNDVGRVTRRPIEIVNWTNEEGGRFSPPMVASGAFAGEYAVDWVHARPTDEGATLGGELARIGYLGEAPVGGRAVDCYFELHIEQGPTLDAAGLRVGIVTHGYTSHGFRIEARGETAHTGPWPMERRRNALVGVARLCACVDDIGWSHAATGGKATAARIVAWPNKPGILSDWAETTCDVRHEDPAVANEMAEEVRRAIVACAGRARVDMAVLDEWSWGGRIFDEGLIRTVRASAKMLGLETLDVASQAGHDAYFMARLCPAAMIFTPCRGGVTHHNLELTTKEEQVPGCNVLLHAVLARADREDGSLEPNGPRP